MTHDSRAYFFASAHDSSKVSPPPFLDPKASQIGGILFPPRLFKQLFLLSVTDSPQQHQHRHGSLLGEQAAPLSHT